MEQIIKKKFIVTLELEYHQDLESLPIDKAHVEEDIENITSEYYSGYYGHLKKMKVEPRGMKIEPKGE
jgi:hypothetical protein